jgi:hypothetical protein
MIDDFVGPLIYRNLQTERTMTSWQMNEFFHDYTSYNWHSTDSFMEFMKDIYSCYSNIQIHRDYYKR